MKMSAYDSIIKGLNEAVQYKNGELQKVKVDRVVIASLPRFHGGEIKTIRCKQKMTQKTLAAVLSVSIKTVEAWESGKNVPEGPAQRVLELMNKDDKLLERYVILSRK